MCPSLVRVSLAIELAEAFPSAVTAAVVLWIEGQQPCLQSSRSIKLPHDASVASHQAEPTDSERVADQ